MTDTVIFGPGYIVEDVKKSETAYPLWVWSLGHFDKTVPDRTRKLCFVRSRELNELRSRTELIFEGSSASSLSCFAFYFKDGQVSTFRTTNLFRFPSPKSWYARASAWAERYDQAKIVLTEAEEELYYRDELLDVMDVD